MPALYRRSPVAVVGAFLAGALSGAWLNLGGVFTQRTGLSTAEGATRTKIYPLPATSRFTVHVPTEGFAGVEQGVSVVPARTDLPIWIEHADYWNNFKAGRLSQGTGERSRRVRRRSPRKR